MRTGVREPWGGPLIAYLGPIDRTTQVLIARSVWAESQPVFFRFLRSPVCGSGPLTVRKLDAPELDRCWTFISRDITEPIFMLEYGSHDLMIDPGEAGDIFLVDLFDNLDWGDMWKSFMERAVSLAHGADIDRAAVAAGKALSIAERKGGPEHPRTVFSLEMVGLIGTLRHDWELAERSRVRALEVMEKTGSPDDLRLAPCLDEMAAASLRASAISARNRRPDGSAGTSFDSLDVSPSARYRNCRTGKMILDKRQAAGRNAPFHLQGTNG